MTHITKIENTERIVEIVMKPTAHTKCRIGQDWYECIFDVYFVPDKCYPDYMEVKDYVMHNLDGHELNIEEAARALYDHLMKYEPKHLKVVNHIRNCKTHFDVDVTIED